MSIRVLHYKIYDDDRIESFPRLTFPIGEYIFDDLNSENEERRLHTHFPRPFPVLFDATV